MASHVPFRAVRPDDQFSTTTTTSTKSPPSITTMDSRPEPPISPTVTRIPHAIRFPAVVALSLGLSALLHSFTSSITGLELATASRDATETWQVGALLGWRVVMLGVGWGVGYDYQDLASLTLLLNAPYYYLLYTLWSLAPLPILVSLFVDIATTTIPFYLLRPAHAHTPTAGPSRTANQAVARDWQIDILTAGLAAVVYAVTFYLTYLLGDFSVFLVTHFDYIPTFERMHAATVLNGIQLFAANGVAAMLFLFRPAMAASGPPKTVTTRRRASSHNKKFKPETATLAETVLHNLGWGEAGPSHRAEVLAKRTAVLVLGTVANTFVRVYGTVDGTDGVGSLGYAGLWAVANGFVAVAYGVLGQE